MVAADLTKSPCPDRGALPTIGVVPIDLNECYAIAPHFDPGLSRRTPTGELLHDAKTYGAKPGLRPAADRLGACMAWWADHLAQIERLSVKDVDVVCSVPSNPPKQPFDLPAVLATAVALALNRDFDRTLITKDRVTDQVKYAADKEAKETELAGAFSVHRDLTGLVVLIVDDLVLSGATLEEIARTMRAKGAQKVLAMVATRATKGLNPN